MKRNTQKILLALYSQVGGLKNRVPLDKLQLVVPELSDGGFRSLLHVLKKQGSIVTGRVMGVTSVSITNRGTLLLEGEFPALSSQWDTWNGEWECMVFTASPSFDKQFRYLRKLLISQGALAINRGVYMSPGGFNDKVMSECQNSYFSNVLIFSVGEWKIAKESSFVIEKYGLLDLVETYSGVSNYVERLLITLDTKKRLTSSHKAEISLVYDRVIELLLEDPGFCSFYFKEVKSIKNTILSLNSLLSL